MVFRHVNCGSVRRYLDIVGMREECSGNDILEMVCSEGSSDARYVFSGQDQ